VQRGSFCFPSGGIVTTTHYLTWNGGKKVSLAAGFFLVGIYLFRALTQPATLGQLSGGMWRSGFWTSGNNGTLTFSAVQELVSGVWRASTGCSGGLSPGYKGPLAPSS
jgi:hypothetical protein